MTGMPQCVVLRRLPNCHADMFDAVIGMMSGEYNSEEFSAFRPRLVWNRDNGLISARSRFAESRRLPLAVRFPIEGCTPWSCLRRTPAKASVASSASYWIEEMVYESRVGDPVPLGTSTWQIQEITRDRVVVTPAPGRTARLPFSHGEGAGRDYGFSRTIARFTREIAAGLDVKRTEGRSAAEGPAVPTFIPTILTRLPPRWPRCQRHHQLGPPTLRATSRRPVQSPATKPLTVERTRDEDGRDRASCC